MSIITEVLPEIKLVGICVRTSNQNELNKNTALIGRTFHEFMRNNMSSRINDQINSDRLIALYTEYESNEHGSYTYFLGQEVSSFNNVSSEFQTCIIPAQTYLRYTSPVGSLPGIVIETWQNIWQTNYQAQNLCRAYQADFEIYDSRSYHPTEAIVHIYVGVRTL